MGRTGERITYRELNERSVALARLLTERGVQPGDTIAIMAENHPRYMEVYWAAIRSGLYLTAISRHLSPEEAAYLVNDSGARVLITTTAMAPCAREMLGHIHRCPLRLMMDGEEAGFEPYEDAIDGRSVLPLDRQPRGELLLYSSGTTGRPKGIQRPLSGKEIDDPSFVGLGALERGLLGMDEHSVYLCPAPLYHAAALGWSAGVHEIGGTLVVMERFDAAELLELIAREQVTHTQVVPTMLVRLLKLPEASRRAHDLSTLRAVVHAAAPCPVEVKRAVIDWLGPIVVEYYAGTEGNGLTFITSEEWLAHPGSVGRPVIGTPHICDEAGLELEVGGRGLVYFARETAPFEYRGDAEKTASSRHPRHPTWTTLGDIGYLDEEGYLYLTDRRAFTIISGGVNIYPAEIESCMVMHPAVADVAVFGLPDEEMGEYVVAVVQPMAGTTAIPELAEELRAYVRSHLAGLKVPRRVEFRAELPRLPTGKLVKGRLRNEYLAREAGSPPADPAPSDRAGQPST